MLLNSSFIKNQDFLPGLCYLRDIRIDGGVYLVEDEWPNGVRSCKWSEGFLVPSPLRAWPGLGRPSLVTMLPITIRWKIDKDAVINIGWVRLSSRRTFLKENLIKYAKKLTCEKIFWKILNVFFEEIVFVLICAQVV